MFIFLSVYLSIFYSASSFLSHCLSPPHPLALTQPPRDSTHPLGPFCTCPSPQQLRLPDTAAQGLTAWPWETWPPASQIFNTRQPWPLLTQLLKLCSKTHCCSDSRRRAGRTSEGKKPHICLQCAGPCARHLPHAGFVSPPHPESMGACLLAQIAKNLPTMQEYPSSVPGSGRPPGEGDGYPLQ